MGWARYSGTRTATETTSEAALLVALTAPGEVCVDVVSLFPPDAVQGLFRRDLFETLRALEPPPRTCGEIYAAAPAALDGPRCATVRSADQRYSSSNKATTYYCSLTHHARHAR